MTFGSWKRIYINKLKEWAQRQQPKSDKTISVMSWRRFSRLISASEVKTKFLQRRAVKADEQQHGFIERVSTSSKEWACTVVIDIAQLPDYLQSFIVGDIITLIRECKNRKY